MATYRIPPETRIGSVHLRVRDLQRALNFYHQQLGLHARIESEHSATLAASASGPALYRLSGDENAPASPHRATGLYHVAVRFPDRPALGAALARLVRRGARLLGAADHLVSEAIYLQDPDGNGLEIYRDRPREQWPVQDGQIAMATDPLELDSLLAAGSSADNGANGLPEATDIGHLHLQVSDLSRAEAFYSGLLGMDVTQRSYPGALFFSAGGYHHHIGANIWAGQGAPRPPQGALGLVSFEIVLPDEKSRLELLRRTPEEIKTGADDGTLQDPDGNLVVLVSA